MVRGLIIVLFLLPPAYLCYLIAIYVRTRVPHVATPRKRLTIILSEMHVTPDTVIYDMGCGTGNVLFAAEKFHPKKLIGFELSALHAWYGQCKAWLRHSQVQIYRQNFYQVNISEADIIYVFLVQSAVEKLWPKIKREAKPGAKVIVLCNHFTQAIPHHIVMPVGEKADGAKFYVYIMERALSTHHGF